MRMSYSREINDAILDSVLLLETCLIRVYTDEIIVIKPHLLVIAGVALSVRHDNSNFVNETK